MDNKLYYNMLRIRMIEEEIAKRYPEGKMRCPVHLSIGQEAAAVGVAAALGPEDKMVSTHRAHAHYLAKGGSLNGLIGELYGKRSGCSRGNGGSMHLIDLDVNFYGSTSIVGGTIAVGVGLAFADRLKGNHSTTVVCVGDAAIEEGVFHEAANFAALHRLNVIFACENNLYSCYTHISNRQPQRSLHDVARGHGINYYNSMEQNVEAVLNSAYQAKNYSSGPAFLEIPTYRHLQHCGPDNDDHLGYRDVTEISYWRAQDPVRVVEHAWIAQIKAEIDAAFVHAEASPPPDDSEIGAYVFKNN